MEPTTMEMTVHATRICATVDLVRIMNMGRLSSPPPTLTAVRMAQLIGEAVESDGLSEAEFARRVGASTKHVNQVLSGGAHAYQATLDYWAFVLGRKFQIELVPLNS